MEAAKALYAIEKGAKVADVLEAPRRVSPEDESLIRELVYGCTRQKRLLDHHLTSFCATPFQKLPVEVRISLRLGLYQLLFLTRVPAYSAVHESVELVKKAGHVALSGFSNAVLRNAETKKASLELKGDSEIDTLALRYSHPTWLVKKWAEALPAEALENVLKANNHPHPVYLNVRPGAGEKVVEELKGQGAQVLQEAWPKDTYRLKRHEGGVFTGESFRQGDWIVQDWVPQAMLEILPLKEGERAWDVCSAPGGKTVGLAWRLGEKGQVLATDASPERRLKLEENLKRTGLKQVSVFGGDIGKLPPQQKFDHVWVDAPCSGTGVLSRRADLRWRLIPKDIPGQMARQKELLEAAQAHVYPGGKLVYSTCSLEKEENQSIVADFLQRHPEFEPFPLQVPGSHPGIVWGKAGITFWPTSDHDGGFLSVLQRS